MDIKNHFEILYNDSPNPCSITDMETGEVVFHNHAMMKLLKESNNFSSHQSGESLLRLLQENEEKYTADSPLDQFEESHVFIEKFDQTYRVNRTLTEFRGRLYSLCKYFVASSYANQLITFEEALASSVEIFANKKNFDEMTNAFLELLAGFYECERAYVFHINGEQTQIASQYFWVKNDDDYVVDDLASKLPLGKLLDFMKHRNLFGIMEAGFSEEQGLNSPTYMEKEMLETFSVDNITACAIENEKNQCIGVVGFSNRATKAFDHRLLRAVTRFVEEGFDKSGMQEELKIISETDFLTGFFSRPKYVTLLEEYATNTPRKLGAVFVNINGLRKTNEYMGFVKGDEQIAKVANILRTFFVEPFYRISGDEFVCFCEDEQESVFLKKVDRIRNDLKNKGDYPFAIGHAWKQGNIDVPKLVAEADTVMYINKQEYYHATHRTNVEESDSILSDLLSSISDEEFLVFLQPQVNLKDGSLIGAEALIRRMDRKNNKMIFPDQFIPIYEQKSIIRHVDIFVLNKVCQLLTQWGKENRQIPISVNLSRVTLIEYDIVNTVAKICNNYRIPHDLIVFEITERIGLIENDVATSLIDQFKEQGFRVSLDDFGCAYSNIVTLANISVDEVKIDKSLVDHLLDNEKNQIIVDSMVTMCNKFANTHTLAEGVETQEQADILRKFGCTYGQGYLYSRPIPNEEFFEKYVKV